MPRRRRPPKPDTEQPNQKVEAPKPEALAGEVLPPEADPFDFQLPQYRGRGRPPLLDREILEAICWARARGMSIVAACRTCYVTAAAYHKWVAKGVEDQQRGKKSIYTEFVDRVRCESDRGELHLHSKVFRAIEDPSERNLKAAQVAVAALNMRKGGKRGADKGRANRLAQGAEQPPAPVAGAQMLDLSAYTPEEKAQLDALIKKGLKPMRALPEGE